MPENNAPRGANSKEPQNGKLALLQTLATSGDSWVKLGTLALVAVSGFGNFFTTNQNARETRASTRAEVEQVVRQVNEIHANQNEYMKDAAQAQETNRIAHENQAAIAAMKANQEWLLRYLSRKDGKDPPEF